MPYEHLDAPSTVSGHDARRSALPVDQSRRFLGGHHHPWRRFFARTVDLCTAGLALFLLLIFGVSAAMPERMAGIAKAIENPIIAGVLLFVVWLPVESALLALFGTTPAKWLFGIRVACPSGDRLSFPAALKRSLLVFVRGVGLGIPIFALFTQLFAYRRLTKTGTTTWDVSAGAVVLHVRWGVLRTLLCTGTVVLVLFLMSVLNATGSR